jgi:thiamine-phosphate pyrophosphorylase
MDLRLVVITDRQIAAPRPIEEIIRVALMAGAPAVQLRDKHATAARLYQDAITLRAITHDHGALLFINDRLDVAIAARADGVHLGPEDLPVAAARRAARAAGRPDLLIGASTDDPDRARQLAEEGADYLGCGAVYGTRSKPEIAGERIGVERLRKVVEAVAIPVLGIGGIEPGNARGVARAGARGAAVIGAVMGADDVAAAVRRLLEPFPLTPDP